MQSWCLPRGIHNQAREINIPVMDLFHHARVQHMSLKQCFLNKNKCDVASLPLPPQMNDHEQELHIELHTAGPWAQ